MRARWARPTLCTSTSQAARAAGYADVVAPPMFAVVYSSPALGPAIFDPELEINFAMMVHGGQAFEWGPLVVAGDEITTEVSVNDISEDGPVAATTRSSRSPPTSAASRYAAALWTQIVRGV